MAARAHFRLAAMACIAMTPLAVAAPALADVKTGVDAWSRGDYDTAVAEWRGPAAKGDPDAQFNLAQAYRLGRGVEANEKQAEVFYAKAADKGHLKAADNLGLLMFQDGRRQEAMPYVSAAADRGDPRAQYLLGIAHFNGDLVEKDWVRAYALLTLANSAGLPQAAPAITQMDEFIPLEQREQAQTVATTIKRDADARRASQLAAADLAGGTANSVAPPPAAAAPQALRAAATMPTARATGGAAAIPRPIPTASVAPSVAAAQAAVAEAQRVTGTQSPALAGANYARPASGPPVRTATGTAAATPVPAPAPAAIAAATPAPRSEPKPEPQPAPAPAPAATGPWKVQLGAFSVRNNAERLWTRLSSRSEIFGREKLLVDAGRLTKLQAGGYASRGDAQSACNALKRSGQSCLVTR
ncbi:SPOR domain-containing protein [Altererythrobacter sp. MTPC7]|uniref:SPOR domain-containing protein n=1 Tax=Altererythrobacter sp. MTPC7 TaxID=3056567 RepID=UPI0036F2F241